MSHESVKSDNRCPVCGGRMRLVNVTWVNSFRTPEASQYDLSVSRRKALLGNTPKSSSQEWMCFSCSRRSPIEDEKPEKEKNVKKEKKNKQGNKKSGAKGNRVASVIGWLLILAVLVAMAYFAYKYHDLIGGYADDVADLIDKATDFLK